MAHIPNWRDIGAGALFCACGSAALWLGRHLAVGDLAAMGPGFFPRAIGALLVALGAAIAVRGGRKDASGISRFAWRPLLAVLGGLVLFAVTIRPAGLLASTLALTVVGRLARPEYGWRETAVLATTLALATGLLFRVALRVPVPLLPNGWTSVPWIS
ncbi:tripartite tricarboxylate transporter TctB family protein [Thauera sp. 2A1]|uniref:tripartite tricarboxylate transporter TctB family protein n=1 Tax=Thauera sp. 2A1 TaxID=2570191 RepID=UPI001884C5A0|nr:tripartite tricarboxylate transporter TctB family protein [Thauera sp. 2A1]KAI5913456.1 tripartite tricarboxylate transporter TctB family protein [Thauera sp. 2A1]